MLHIKYDGKIYEYAEGTTYEEIAKDFQSKYAARIALVIANGKIRELLKAPDAPQKIFTRTNCPIRRTGRMTNEPGRSV